jgi:tRNA dimethylallyltransferase
VATHKTILIAGPTASGKSAAALRIAEQTGGVIINADALQVYRDLAVITARPTADDEKRVVHRLYGQVDAAEVHSVGAWLRDVIRLMNERFEGPLIFCGGTGLYFEALTRGLAEVPPVPDDVTSALRSELAEIGFVAMLGRLAAIDPIGANAIKPGDAQRLLRALAVVLATGKPLSEWQSQTTDPLLRLPSAETLAIAILPETVLTAASIEKRLTRMIGAGALEEIAALKARDLPADRPCQRAIGVAEFGSFLDGDASMDDAMARANAATRQYAKRQRTWLRNRMGDPWVKLATPEAAAQTALDFLKR